MDYPVFATTVNVDAMIAAVYTLDVDATLPIGAPPAYTDRALRAFYGIAELYKSATMPPLPDDASSAIAVAARRFCAGLVHFLRETPTAQRACTDRARLFPNDLVTRASRQAMWDSLTKSCLSDSPDALEFAAAAGGVAAVGVALEMWLCTDLVTVSSFCGQPLPRSTRQTKPGQRRRARPSGHETPSDSWTLQPVDQESIVNLDAERVGLPSLDGAATLDELFAISTNHAEISVKITPDMVYRPPKDPVYTAVMDWLGHLEPRQLTEQQRAEWRRKMLMHHFPVVPT